MSEKLTFKLVRAEREVTLVENEVATDYVIREMDGPKYNMYMNHVGKRTRFKDGEAVGFKEFNSLASFILSLTLFPKGSDTCVSEEVISKWPISVQDQLADIARELSGIGTRGGDEEEDEDDSKNS